MVIKKRYELTDFIKVRYSENMTSQAHIAYQQNFDCFRDALSSALIEKISTPSRSSKSKVKSRKKSSTKHMKRRTDESSTDANTAALEIAGDPENNSAGDLADFAEYIALLAFAHLPPELQSLTHRLWIDGSLLREEYLLPLTSNDVMELIIPSQDPSLADSLTAYGILTPPHSDLSTFLAPVLTSYITSVTAAPPPPSSTRASECEICGRDWVPLTYHHLIPKMVHAKAVKRGWHRAEDVNSVAWLCRACHSFVHRFQGHEALAREYFTVERLMGAEEVRAFAGWVGRVRWKAR